MQIDDVVAAIDPAAIARDTLEFVQVASETGTEGPGSRFFADLCGRAGLEVEVDPFEPERPNVYARLPGGGGSEIGAGVLLFNGHVDTIPIGDSDPPALTDGWVVGRGAEDMKGGLVASVHAAAALRAAGVRLSHDLWLTGVVGHETPAGKKEGPKRLIARVRDGEIPADSVVVVEGPNAIWSAGLGSAMFSITLRSARGIVHTIGVPYAENPARWLGDILQTFAEWQRQFDQEPAHPLCGRQVVNVGQVQGGDYPNRLPTPLVLRGTRRWLHAFDSNDIAAEIQALCDDVARRSGLDAEFSMDGPHEAWETSHDEPVVGALQSAARHATGRDPRLIGMALGCDANLYANYVPLPTVCYGPEYATAHSDHERVAVERLAQCARVYALAAMQFCGVAQ